MFDVDLFATLNEEWRDRPLVPTPMKTDPASLAARAEQRTRRMSTHLDLAPGRRVLEIGCGRGHLARRIADHSDVEVVGVDLERYEAWDDLEGDGVSFLAADIADLGSDHDEGFDAAYSISVWEHVEHPATALETAFRLLRPGGVMFLQAQLYPGPKASHRYREVFFPWPHLLFEDHVFEQYYVDQGKPPKRPAYLNRWTDLHYRFHVDRVGFEALWWATPDPWFDEEFYERFRTRLSPFPRWDLSHDAVILRLRKPTRDRTSTGGAFSAASATSSVYHRARRAAGVAKRRSTALLRRRR